MKKYPVFSYLSRCLKNGTIYPEPLIAQTVNHIEAFKMQHPEDFFELVKLCRFSGYEVSPQSREHFEQAELFYNGKIKDIIRDVILSSVIGRSLKDLEVTSPIKDDTAARLLC